MQKIEIPKGTNIAFDGVDNLQKMQQIGAPIEIEVPKKSEDEAFKELQGLVDQDALARNPSPNKNNDKKLDLF